MSPSNGFVFSILCFLINPINCYNIGIGRADVTGPAAEIGMMGYAKQGQNTGGIHTRLFSRAFIIEDPETRVVFVSIDCAMMGQLVKLFVLEELESLYPGVYNEANVVLSSTHTHSGPAGFMQYVLFNVPNLGFIQETLDSLVKGIVVSIQRAHDNLAPGSIRYTAGMVTEEANINRSPSSYLANPEEERARYEYNTDRDLVQLMFYDSDGVPLGLLNWYAVHPTSMNNTNHLISSDNKGAASIMFEKAVDPLSLVGESSFVAAFASSNLGDVSPNIMGPKCQDTGLPCDVEHSTCNNRTQMCYASGPGKDMFDSTKIIAERQFNSAFDLFANVDDSEELAGPVQYKHQWINMGNYSVNLADGQSVKTCKPALGYSFAAGTTDGPGEFDFTQGDLTGNPFWDFISGLLKDPSPEQEACHAPKPILLDTGEIEFPFPWHPVNIDTQIIRIGQLAILAVPGEFTTMSGRRLRESVAATAAELGQEMKVVIAGLSNTYTHYIATFEEYQKQRYEAASTIYGPHTLSAYIQQFNILFKAMLSGESLERGEPAPNLINDQLSFVPGVIMDNPPPGLHFGDVTIQPPEVAKAGEVVTVKFISGHLRNNLMLEDTFLTIERQEEDGWVVVARDSDWETRLEWHRTNVILGESEVTVHWEIPLDVEDGTYRIGHKGYWHTILRGNSYYEGWTQPFTVTKAQNKGVIGHLNKISNKISNVGSKPVKNSASMLFNPFEFLSRLFTL